MWVTHKILQIPKQSLLFLIRTYQRTISPDHGWFKARNPNGYCKFYPTCSSYGKKVIKKHGLIIGGFKTLYRILRCNPWNKGGIDLVK